MLAQICAHINLTLCVESRVSGHAWADTPRAVVNSEGGGRSTGTPEGPEHRELGLGYVGTQAWEKSLARAEGQCQGAARTSGTKSGAELRNVLCTGGRGSGGQMWEVVVGGGLSLATRGTHIGTTSGLLGQLPLQPVPGDTNP